MWYFLICKLYVCICIFVEFVFCWYVGFVCIRVKWGFEVFGLIV